MYRLTAYKYEYSTVVVVHTFGKLLSKVES